MSERHKAKKIIIDFKYVKKSSYNEISKALQFLCQDTIRLQSTDSPVFFGTCAIWPSKICFFFLLQISRTQARLQDQRSSVLLERELLSSSKFAWGSIRVREQAWYGFPTDIMSSEDLLGCDRPLVGKRRGNGIPGLEKKSYLHITWECMDPLQFWETFQK